MSCTITGIYKIEVNDKIYIGQSKDIHRRWRHHRNLLNRNAHDNPHMQNLFNKYGESFFKFSILEECTNLSEREAFWIISIEPKLRLNLHAVTDTIPVSLETRIKISESKKGKPLSEEHKKKLSDSHMNQFVSEETRSKLSKLRLGKRRSEETRMKISKAQKNKILSPEHKEKIRQSWIVRKGGSI